MSQIIEIGFEIKEQEELELLEKIFTKFKIPYYIEPQLPYKTLEELEAACEGK